MQIKIWQFTLAILASILVGYFLKPDSVTHTAYPIVSKDTITNTVYHSEVTHIPQFIHDTVLRRDTIHIPAQVDTQAVIQNYFTERVFKDTATISEAFITIQDTLFQNAIKGRYISVSNKRVTEIITYKPKLYFGAQVGLKRIEPCIAYFDTKRMYIVGYDVLGKTVGAGVLFKIK